MGINQRFMGICHEIEPCQLHQSSIMGENGRKWYKTSLCLYNVNLLFFADVPNVSSSIQGYTRTVQQMSSMGYKTNNLIWCFLKMVDLHHFTPIVWLSGNMVINTWIWGKLISDKPKDEKMGLSQRNW